MRLLPCDVVARVAVAGLEDFRAEVELAQRLAEVESPVARLDPRVEPRVYEGHGFAVTFWTYYEPSGQVSPAGYAGALERLHAGMATVNVDVPHFSARIAEAHELVASRDRSPELEDSDRELLVNTLETRRRVLEERSGAEQLLHGEPHAGNLLSTPTGPLFVDLETCCRGPVEFDVAHVPAEVGERYSGTDAELLDACRLLVLAMVAAWRCDPDDQLPDGRRAGRELLAAIRAGPPWPTLDAVHPERVP